jgi:hypothetical protein
VKAADVDDKLVVVLVTLGNEEAGLFDVTKREVEPLPDPFEPLPRLFHGMIPGSRDLSDSEVPFN